MFWGWSVHFDGEESEKGWKFRGWSSESLRRQNSSAMGIALDAAQRGGGRLSAPTSMVTVLRSVPFVFSAQTAECLQSKRSVSWGWGTGASSERADEVKAKKSSPSSQSGLTLWGGLPITLVRDGAAR